MKLEIYVEAACPGCERSLHLAAEVERLYPRLPVEVIDLSNTERAVPEQVFAVPTYVLDGRVVSLGNPSWEDLTVRIDAALTAVSR